MTKTALGAALASWLLVACGGSKSSDPGGPSPPGGVPSTPVGTPTGAAAGATIGPAGGRLATSDGRLAVVVPAGAVSADTSFSVQPVTNQAPGGVGSAYRVGPDGVSFAQPVLIVLTYADADLQGTAAEELGVAFQGPDGAWRRMGGTTLDTGARTLALPVAHFTDYAAVAGHLLSPREAAVKVGEQVAFAIQVCRTAADPSQPATPSAPPLVFPCAPIAELMPPVTWEVDGVEGGNSRSGTIQGDNVGATYTAPSRRPQLATVAVSARYRVGTMIFILVARVTVEEAPSYQGSFTLEGMFNGTGTVEFTPTFEDASTVVYQGSVTFQLASISDVSSVCVPTPAANTSEGAMLTIDKVGNAYLWEYGATWAATLSCVDKETGDTFTPNTPAWVVFEPYDASCTFPATFPITDPALLAGTFTGNGCRDAPTTATWSFTRSVASGSALASTPPAEGP